MTEPAEACPTRTTGPVVRSSVRLSACTSSSNDVRGKGAATTLMPSADRRAITFAQLDPLAQAPLTSTTVAFVADIRLFSLAYSNLQIASMAVTIRTDVTCQQVLEWLFKKSIAGSTATISRHETGVVREPPSCDFHRRCLRSRFPEFGRDAGRYAGRLDREQRRSAALTRTDAPCAGRHAQKDPGRSPSGRTRQRGGPGAESARMVQRIRTRPKRAYPDREGR